jgi:hypothetical protein
MIQVAFWLFAALTTAFSLAMLWRLLPRPSPPPPQPLASHLAALSVAAPTGDDAATITTLVNALKDALSAIGDFGTKLDTLHPTAFLGVFTIVFAIMTLICAFKSP